MSSASSMISRNVCPQLLMVGIPFARIVVFTRIVVLSNTIIYNTWGAHASLSIVLCISIILIARGRAITRYNCSPHVDSYKVLTLQLNNTHAPDAVHLHVTNEGQLVLNICPGMRTPPPTFQSCIRPFMLVCHINLAVEPTREGQLPTKPDSVE